jgi:hypothetical protein
MEKHKAWRMEVYDPSKSTGWQTLGEIGEDELVAAEQMRDEQNKINAPVLIRIVRKTHF